MRLPIYNLLFAVICSWHTCRPGGGGCICRLWGPGATLPAYRTLRDDMPPAQYTDPKSNAIVKSPRHTLKIAIGHAHSLRVDKHVDFPDAYHGSRRQRDADTHFAGCIFDVTSVWSAHKEHHLSDVSPHGSQPCIMQHMRL